MCKKLDSKKFQTCSTTMRPQKSALADGAPRVVPAKVYAMTGSKIELIYCVMVVATAVLAGVVKCTTPSSCIHCNFMDP